MTLKLIIPMAIIVSCIQLACTPQVTSTCAECEFVEFEYNENLSIISGFDTTRILVEQPYSDWEVQDSIGTPNVTFSDRVAPDSTVSLRLTVEAGAGSEDERAYHEIGYDGEKFRIWYGSASRRYYKAKQQATPRPPYFRIKEIEVRTPYQKEADIQFNVRFPS